MTTLPDPRLYINHAASSFHYSSTGKGMKDEPSYNTELAELGAGGDVGTWAQVLLVEGL